MSAKRKNLFIFLIILITFFNVEAQLSTTTLSALQKLQLLLGITTTPMTTTTSTTTKPPTTTTQSSISSLLAALLAKLNITTTTISTTTTTTLTTTTTNPPSTTTASISDLLAVLLAKLNITTSTSSTTSTTISSTTEPPTTSTSSTTSSTTEPTTTSTSSTTEPTTTSSTTEPTTTSPSSTTGSTTSTKTSSTTEPTTTSPSSTTGSTTSTTTSSTTGSTTKPTTTSTSSTTEPTTTSTSSTASTTTSSTTEPTTTSTSSTTGSTTSTKTSSTTEPTTTSTSSTTSPTTSSKTGSTTSSTILTESTTSELISTTDEILTLPTISPTLAPELNLSLCSSYTSIYDSFSNFLRGACIIAQPLNFPDAEDFCKVNNFAGLFSVTKTEEWNQLQTFLVNYSILNFGYDFINDLNFHIFGNLNNEGVWKFSDGNLLYSSAIPSIGHGTCLNVYGSEINQISTSQSTCDDVKMFVCEFGVEVHPPAIYLMPIVIPSNACENLQYCRYFTDSNFNVNCIFDYLSPIAPNTDPDFITTSNLQVKNVYYRNCKMLHFPSNVLANFPNAQLLSISNTNFADPILGEVYNCGNLKHLDLSYNPDVTKLTVDNYGICSNLEIIDVTGCSVTEVKRTFVTAFPYLKYVVINKTS